MRRALTHENLRRTPVPAMEPFLLGCTNQHRSCFISTMSLCQLGADSLRISSTRKEDRPRIALMGMHTGRSFDRTPYTRCCLGLNLSV